MIKKIVRRFGGFAAVISLGLVGVAACSAKNDASDIICQPSQKFRCNDCPNAGERGWQQCSSDGRSYASGCTDCAADPSAASPTSGNGNDGTDDSTPKEKSQDAGSTSDAAPPEPQSGSKDAGGGGNPTSDADLPEVAVPVTQASPLDSMDAVVMISDGAKVGTCAGLGLSNDTGLCTANSSTGADFIEGCVNGKAYMLDCATYETAAKRRAVCNDNHTRVGCDVYDVTTVDSWIRGQTAKALDMNHACPPAWEGYGYCAGSYVRMCVNGKDWSLDCKIWNNGANTFTCGTNGATGHLDCI